jgi:hypothetical protein
MESHKIHVPDHQPETVSRPTKIHRTSPTHIHQPSVTEDLGRALGCQQNCRHWRPCPVRGGDRTGEVTGKWGQSMFVLDILTYSYNILLSKLCFNLKPIPGLTLTCGIAALVFLPHILFTFIHSKVQYHMSAIYSFKRPHANEVNSRKHIDIDQHTQRKHTLNHEKHSQT